MLVTHTETGNPIHLTYCLNIHRGETWQENFAAIQTHACHVRDCICGEQPFGLGLRLSAQAARELIDGDRLRYFRDFLQDNRLYAFTINGFPYGRFHGTVVKDQVYAPDWAAPERLTYTRQLAEILSGVLPENMVGTISTVPGAYRCRHDISRLNTIIRNLMCMVADLADLERRTGRRVMLALEPEPDCIWDRTSDVLDLFGSLLPREGYPLLSRLPGVHSDDTETYVSRHLGVCLDTCHQAVLYEDPADSLQRLASTGISVGKIQLSAAPRTLCTDPALARMRSFLDPCYLHQSAIREETGAVRRYPDLEPALAAAADCGPACEFRTHFHIPLVVEKWGEIESTSALLNKRFWDQVRIGGISQLEVETYTFEVLPESLRDCPVEQSIADELRWVLRRLNPGTDSASGGGKS